MSELFVFNSTIDEMFKIEGLVHVYAYDNKYTIIGCNETQLQLIEDTIGIPKKEIIGYSGKELFKDLGNSWEVILKENEEIIRTRLPKQFYNIWVFNDFCKLELLTIKLPLYNNDGLVCGIFGISQYISKFSIMRAFRLGLSKRQTECLILFLEGKSNKEIAKSMNISLRTVEDYFDSLKSKLHCYSKPELITKALQTGLLEGSNMGLNLLNSILIEKDFTFQNNQNCTMLSIGFSGYSSDTNPAARSSYKFVPRI
jgi:DNA-binding CsgD family transcriptional regulator